MLDVKFIMDSYGRFDFEIEDGDLAVEDGYDTAIWISLFTDARADSSQVLTPENRRGWIGDIISAVSGRQLGGYLWLVDQRRLIQKTLNKTIDYTKKSLQWMINDKICSNIEVTGSFVPKFGINLDVSIISKQGIILTKNIKLWQITGR